MTIPAKRRKIPFTFIIGLVLSGLILLLAVNTINQFEGQGLNRILLIGAFGGMLFWVLTFTTFALLDYLKAMFDKNAVLTITDEGVNDNLSIFSVGNIPWTEITNINIAAGIRTHFLVIVVRDPEPFIERKAKFKQRPLKIFLRKFGSPIVISQKRIEYNLVDLKELLLKAKFK